MMCLIFYFETSFVDINSHQLIDKIMKLSYNKLVDIIFYERYNSYFQEDSNEV